MVLWENFADKLIELVPDMPKLKDGHTIILQFAAKSIWDRKIYLFLSRIKIIMCQKTHGYYCYLMNFLEELRVQTTKGATKMIINEELPEIEDFNIRYNL